MGKFFNMIPGGDDCCILLYGDIGDASKVRSGDITRELMEAAATHKKIDVRVNSMGGDVYAGIAIFNALRNCPADMTIYIDGVAASMASGVISCGKPVYMSQYARLMIHRITGGCYGNINELQDCITEIEALEASLCDIYAKRMGITPEEVRERFFDGQEHWLSAQEAKDLGLIDGIYDADPVPEDTTPEQLYKLMQNKYDVSLNTDNMFEKLKKRKAFANFANEEEAIDFIAQLEALAAELEAQKAENAQLREQLQGFQAKAQADEEKEIEELVDTAFEEGRITEPEKELYQNVLKKDKENGKKLLQARPAKKRIINNLGGKGHSTQPGAWDARMEEIRNKKK